MKKFFTLFAIVVEVTFTATAVSAFTEPEDPQVTIPSRINDY